MFNKWILFLANRFQESVMANRYLYVKYLFFIFFFFFDSKDRILLNESKEVQNAMPT